MLEQIEIGGGDASHAINHGESHH
ncbi:uncharacterized protein G2W53_042757 [Senna tora]|uniref:Uncharacterized protein n=1 Tax=Senna tora TaxID=362788 RepID=A0A834W2R0_9FABA|nr:uncharacterized protein G2W53_042757 [Senna tora]